MSKAAKKKNFLAVLYIVLFTLLISSIAGSFTCLAKKINFKTLCIDNSTNTTKQAPIEHGTNPGSECIILDKEEIVF